MLEERQDYLSMLYTEKDIAKLLPYEGEVKMHAAIKYIESSAKLCQAAN
jgi:hypothetical protein